MLARPVFWSIVAAAGAASAAAAQGAQVGSVGEITIIGGNQRCREPGGRPGVQVLRIRRGGRDTVVHRGDTASVLLNDHYGVDRETDVELRIAANRMGRGTLILAPQIICSMAQADTMLPANLSGFGAYEIEMVGPDRLGFTVHAGGAFIQWSRRSPPLIINAGGRERPFSRLRVPGTELVVVVDSANRVATLHVQGGTVIIEGLAGISGEIRVGRGQTYVLRQDAPPHRLSGRGASEARRLAESDIQFHRERFASWPRPEVSLWDKVRPTLPYVGVVAAIAVGIAVWPDGTPRPPPPPPRRRANILIQLPL
jgi:hypothetical protein